MPQATVLVIEDDDDLRELLVMALDDDGYLVHSASSGGVGVQVAIDHKLDLIVTDVRMKDMDGLTALSKISVYQPALKSIVMTGYASSEAPLRALELEAVDYIYKPFAIKTLLKAVERALEPADARSKTMLGSLVGGVRKLVDKVAAAQQSRLLQALEPVRERAFQTYYVAIRSKQLEPRSAHLVWEQLEAAERQRRDLKPGVDLTMVYRYVEDLTKAFCRRHAPTCNRPSEQVPWPSFEVFFKRILNGEIPAHQLTAAAYLRSLTPFELSQSPELLKTRSQYWR